MMPRLTIRPRAPEVPNNNNAGEGEGEGEREEKVEGVKPAKMGRMRLQAFDIPQRYPKTGSVLTCGQGDVGQLGLGEDYYERTRPTLVPGLKDVVDVCAGGMHSLAITSDGTVYSFGCNDEGALGRDTSDEGSEFEPRPVDLPGKAVKVSAGDSHSASLLEDGSVYAWGSFRDSHGNMGLTLEGNKREPISLMPNVKCCDIASGADHLVILTVTGKVYTVGCAEQGQLGRLSMRSASGESRRGKTELLRPDLVVILHSKPINAVWATRYSTFLRESSTGRIYAFGLNNYKQLSIVKGPDIISTPKVIKVQDVKQIAGGQHHTVILKYDGTCLVIGRHEYGRLGLPDIKEDVDTFKPLQKLIGIPIDSISCGEAQTFAVTKDGKVYACGMGSNSQLGTGSSEDILEPEVLETASMKEAIAYRVSGGGQHTIFLVKQKSSPPSKLAPSETLKPEINSLNNESENNNTLN